MRLRSLMTGSGQRHLVIGGVSLIFKFTASLAAAAAALRTKPRFIKRGIMGTRKEGIG